MNGNGGCDEIFEGETAVDIAKKKKRSGGIGQMENGIRNLRFN